MKLKFLFFTMAAVFISAAAQAAESAGLQFIVNRGYVVCGTDTDGKTLAYKDEDGVWTGIDAAICRNFAEAIFGNSAAFRLENVPTDQAARAIAGGKIDIMLGNSAFSARAEISSSPTPIDVLYYDRQVFAVREDTEATSMEEFKGAKVCVLDNSPDLAALNEYNQKYALAFKILPFPSFNAAKQAFYLKRCQLISGGEIFLAGLVWHPINKNNPVKILPEVIAPRPVYAYADKNNPNLQIIGRWIINAPKLAEQYGASSKNIDAFIGVRDASLKNLLGLEPKLWHSFGLHPDWLTKAVKARGNFGEMFERNLGKDSPLQIERDKNYIIDKGGLITARPFI